MAYQNRENQPSTATNPPVPEMPARVSIDQVTRYEVYDAQNEHIGSTTAIWMDRNDQPAFIGIKTSRLFGKTHVIPAWGAEVNHRTQRVRIPCPRSVVNDAPSFSPEEELDVEKERQVLDYFKTKGACQPRAEAGTREAESRRESAEETNIPLHEEQVKVGKRTVETGGIRLRKVVRTETVQQPVELKHEEIQVERVPASGERRPAEHAFEGEDIYIPLRREEAVVEKETRVREEVRARKTTGTEQKTVSGEVRKEDVEIEQERRRKAA